MTRSVVQICIRADGIVFIPVVPALWTLDFLRFVDVLN
jgi:hypothetical protein